MPSLATNGDWGRNSAMTSRPLDGSEVLVIRPCFRSRHFRDFVDTRGTAWFYIGQ